jgi:hypothetical protein
MFDHRSPAIWILLLLGMATAAPARADGPRAGFKLSVEDTFISPDRALRVEQYSKDLKDEGFLYQFWTFDRGYRHRFLLNRCVYDLKTGTFSVPPDFAENNAKAIKPPSPPSE